MGSSGQLGYDLSRLTKDCEPDRCCGSGPSFLMQMLGVQLGILPSGRTAACRCMRQQENVVSSLMQVKDGLASNR